MSCHVCVATFEPELFIIDIIGCRAGKWARAAISVPVGQNLTGDTTTIQCMLRLTAIDCSPPFFFIFLFFFYLIPLNNPMTSMEKWW